jgi:hypothetical protein
MEGKYEKNIFFFGDVVKKFGSIKDFSRTFYRMSLNEDELFDQLGQQIFINSKIASKKLGSVKQALRLMALGLLLLLILALYYSVLSFL